MDTLEQLQYYKSITDKRIEQADDVYNALKNNFDFDYIECIETGTSQNLLDGCFGIYLGKIAESKNGIFHTVDIDESKIQTSKLLFEEYLPNVNIGYHSLDSVEFLSSYKGSPNLVHLDSWDLDLTNPVPSMLHGWLEFDAIKDKMPSGSILIVDDNFLKGTWVNWMYVVDGSFTDDFKRIDITYDIIGKGSLIYHWCQKENTDWDLIGDHYMYGRNIKIIIKKR